MSSATEKAHRTNALSAFAISLAAEGFIGWGICRYASKGKALDWAIRNTNDTGWITASKNKNLTEEDLRGLYAITKKKSSELQLMALLEHPKFPLDLARQEFIDEPRGHHMVAISYPRISDLLDSFEKSEEQYGLYVEKLAKLLTSSKIKDKSIFTTERISQVFNAEKSLISSSEQSTYAYRVNLLVERMGADKKAFSDEDLILVASSDWPDLWVREECFNLILERNIHEAAEMPSSWARRFYNLPDEGADQEIVW